MKIRYDIQEKYAEAEIHLCDNEKSQELIRIHELLEGLFDIKVLGYQNHEVKEILPSRIVRIFSENKKVYVRTESEVYEVRERLYVLEEQLKGRGFVRISNSEIVNLQQIDKLDMSHAGTIKMYMENQDVTYVSRRYIKKIKDELSKEVV